MNEIYNIIFFNGDYDIVIYGFTDSEEKAENLVQKLNSQLSIDENRVRYLKKHGGLVFDEKGSMKDKDSEYAKEYNYLINKYPRYHRIGYIIYATFYYEKTKKLELD